LNAAAPVRDALAAATDAIAAAGSDTPRLDAELLLADALDTDRAALVANPDAPVPPPAARIMMASVRRRVAREPVAYIVGRKGFRHIDLEVDSRVLVPRPETELLVEVALELERSAEVHDVGTGSGAVALAIKDERPDLIVSGSDVSLAAVALARNNAARLALDVDFEVAAWLPEGRAYELVVANLPYVREDEWPRLAPEIALYEPREALVSGPDGLDAIRTLVEQAPRGTRLALEHDPRQAAAVRSLLEEAETRRDLAGRERVTVGRAP
jgi:release factor glutamine methyltransferase